MNELFVIVNENADRAKQRRQAEDMAAAKRSLESDRERARRQKALDADLKMGLRFLWTVFLLKLLSAGVALGQVAPSTACFFLLCVLAWLMFRVGAWWQARVGEGGRFKC
ncbi:MAG: hypothetical protein ACI4P4_03740 [Faecousia sp.]